MWLQHCSVVAPWRCGVVVSRCCGVMVSEMVLPPSLRSVGPFCRCGVVCGCSGGGGGSGEVALGAGVGPVVAEGNEGKMKNLRR